MVEYVQHLVLEYVHVQMVLLVVYVKLHYVNISWVIIFYEFICIILAVGSCNQIQCSNGGTCLENSPGSIGQAYCTCKGGYTGKYCETG